MECKSVADAVKLELLGVPVTLGGRGCLMRDCVQYHLCSECVSNYVHKEQSYCPLGLKVMPDEQ